MNPRHPMRAALIATFVCALPGAALANVLWPELILVRRMSAWWVIGAGLIIEFFFLWWMFRLPLWKTAAADIVANGASALIGVYALPWIGWQRELLLAPLGLLTLRLPNFLTALLLVLVLNVLIEGLIYRVVFRLPLGLRNLLWLVLANAVTIALTFVSFSFVPLKLR